MCVVPSPLFLTAVSSPLGAVWVAHPWDLSYQPQGGCHLLQKRPDPREKQPELDPTPPPLGELCASKLQHLGLEHKHWLEEHTWTGSGHTAGAQFLFLFSLHLLYQPLFLHLPALTQVAPEAAGAIIVSPSGPRGPVGLLSWHSKERGIARASPSSILQTAKSDHRIFVYMINKPACCLTRETLGSLPTVHSFKNNRLWTLSRLILGMEHTVWTLSHRLQSPSCWSPFVM